MKLRPVEQMVEWQTRLSKLFSYMLRCGMPMEQLQIVSFKEMLFQSRNAEESLLVALNGCANLTQQVSIIDQPELETFGAWLRRIQGQRTGPESSLAARCLSFLDLRIAELNIGDFFRARLQGTNLQGIEANLTCFRMANLMNAKLQLAELVGADFLHANLLGANLLGANLLGANLKGANLEGANLNGANLGDANLDGARLQGANLEGAELNGANLEGANLNGANFYGAKLNGANLEGAKLEGAKLEGANLQGARLYGVDLREAVGLSDRQLPHASGDALTRLPEGITRPEHWPAA